MPLLIYKYTRKKFFYFFIELRMYEERLMQLSLRLLYLGGQHPLSYGMFSKIHTYFCLIFSGIVCVLVLLKMWQEYENIDVLVPTFESLVSLFQVKINSKKPNSTRYFCR